MGLAGIVSASLIFSSTDNPVLTGMFPFGIGLIWYSTSLGILWYGIFGRLQCAYGTAQDVVGILQAGMLLTAARSLAETPEKIPATAVAIICLSAVLTGACSIALGKLGLGKYMLLFPAPVINGFLGAIGFVILRSSLQTSSGVHFVRCYPEDLEAFLAPNSLAQVGLQVAMVLCIRLGPPALQRLFPRSDAVGKLGGIVCQLVPLVLFYVGVAATGSSIDALTEMGWMYPKQHSSGLIGHWTTYSWRDVDPWALLQCLWEMPALILMAVLCTTTGALAITDRFPSGPPGDPNPTEAVDFDMELSTAGVSSLLLGLTGGTLTFHTFTAIQLRLDGGTHRVAVLSVALFVFSAFASGAPIGHFIPKWFLSGLFMNTAFHFLRGSLLSYRALPSVSWLGLRLPSPQYLVTLCGILVSMFSSPATAIGIGMLLSSAFFMVQSTRTSPVVNVVVGDRVVSRTKRPFWEMRVLRQEGSRILLIYLQGQLFFGSVRRLVAALTAAASSERVQFIVLSFARVPVVDPSAARHLKAIAEKASLTGCRIICCRTNLDVFSSLRAVGVIAAPDADLLLHLKGLRWTAKSDDKLGRKHGSHRPRPGDASWIPRVTEDIVADSSRPQSPGLRAGSEVSLGQPEPDAFAHETDALDYCNERLLADFCYGPLRSWAGPSLEPHQLAFRRAAAEGARLDEWAFEAMNHLPEGFMGRLREHCEVLDSVSTWKELEEFGSLIFILRGSISMVQMLPHAQVELDWGPEVRGFSFRVGKRLQKRYPPGHVVGKVEFFLRPLGHVVDRDLVPRAIVSSKLAPSAEVWILRREAWEAAPAEIRGPLTEMLCAQMADDTQHSQMQES